MSVTLPTEMAADVRAKVESGEYASESEVIRDGLRALAARERAVEDWLSGPVTEIYEAMKAEPSRARSASDVRAALAAEHKRTGQKKS
jgi:putative addiction module CopG family antidote